jgi:hypothetical protein
MARTKLNKYFSPKKNVGYKVFQAIWQLSNYLL